MTFSVFGINSASGTLSTAEQLVTASGGATTAGVGTKVGTSTGWGELFSQGTTNNWAGAGAMGAPSGNGWLYDSSQLENQTVGAGTWTIAHHLFNNGSNNYTADIWGNVYKRSSGGTYTLIGSLSLLAQTITTSAALFTLSGSLSSMAFASGDKLYHDLWLNVASGGSGAAVKINESRGSGASGAAGFAEIDMPNFSPTTGGHTWISDGFGGTFT